jgi:hypothetical protein
MGVEGTHVTVSLETKGSNPMAVVYIVVAAFVITLLLSFPLFPFWKVWKRLQTHHPDIWQSAGPFKLADMIASPGLAGIFIDVLIRMENDKALQTRDPEMGKWCRVSMELMRLLPKTFPAQIGYSIIFLYFANVLTMLLLSPFRH